MSEDIITQFNDLLTKFNEDFDEEIFDYSRKNIPTLIDLEYNGKWNGYLKDLMNKASNDSQYIRYSSEIIKAIRNSEHSDITNKINEFTIGDTYSLTISYGFGRSFWQIFPQDPEYIDRFFNKFKKNVIIGFETDDGPEGGPYGISGNIFKVGPRNANIKGYKKKVTDMIKSVFNINEVRVEKIKNLGLFFYFKNYLFIWVNSQMNIPLICTHYTSVLDKSSEKNIICSTLPGCGDDFNKYDFYKSEFLNMIEVMYNNTISHINTSTNIVPFKESTMVRRLSRNGTKSKNIWNGLGGKRKSRRLNKHSSKNR